MIKLRRSAAKSAESSGESKIYLRVRGLHKTNVDTINKNSKESREVTNHEENTIHFRRDCVAIYDSSCSIYWES